MLGNEWWHWVWNGEYDIVENYRIASIAWYTVRYGCSSAKLWNIVVEFGYIAWIGIVSISVVWGKSKGAFG